MIEGPSGQRTLIRGVFGRGEGREPASDPSRRAPRAAGRAFLRRITPSHLSPPSRQRRWFRGAEEPVVEGCGGPPTSAIEYDPRARPRIERAPRCCSEENQRLSLVAWRRVESSPFRGEEPPAGLLRNQGPYRLFGPIQRRAFTIARERSGATPIRLTRTPSVAGSWEGPGGEPSAPGERRSRRARPGFPERVKR